VSMPNLLFVSPVVPAPTGGGSPMRAGMLLEALAEHHDIFLFVVPVLGMAPIEQTLPFASRWCRRIAVHFPKPAETTAPDPRDQPAGGEHHPKQIRERLGAEGVFPDPRQVFDEVRFQTVHVFRVYMAPFAGAYLRMARADRPLCVLDLDDYESQARQRIADLLEAQGDQARSDRVRSESLRYRRLEEEYLPLFDRIYVCSEPDRAAISRRYGGGAVAVVPNAVRIPETQPGGRAAGPFTLLFFGTMNYEPNEDAAVFFCAEILPLLRQRATRPFRVVIAGRRPTPRVMALASNPEVTVAGEVPEVGKYYRDADAVIVPLRAGGGTRIKILEACSYRRPVVSTRIGAEGLEVSPGRELLAADCAEEFAERCLFLMQEPEEARRLADRGFDWVQARHTLEAVKRALAACSKNPPETGAQAG